MEDSSRKLMSINISPGFKHTDPNKTTFLERASEELWTDLVKETVGSEVNWQLITSYNEWGGGTSVESAVDWQTESGYGMYLDVLNKYAILENLTISSTNSFSQTGPIKDLPFTIKNKTLQLCHRADRIVVYSMTGRVILHELNISSLALEFNEPIAILSIELDDKLYRYKYINL